MNHGKSFSVDLGKWLNVMEAYEGGGFKYYTTLPTDALTQFRNVIRETASFGYDEAKAALWTLGNRVREEMAKSTLDSDGCPCVGGVGRVIWCGLLDCGRGLCICVWLRSSEQAASLILQSRGEA